MKKLFAIILCLAMLASFAACGEGETPSGTGSEGGTSSVVADEFKAPETYSSIVQITINPVVNLYLDENNIVLAVEMVNQDAKDTYSAVKTDIVGAKLDAGVEKLIDKAKEGGFLAADKAPTVTIDVVECKIAEKKFAIMSEAGSTVKEKLTENKIVAEISVKDNGAAVDSETLKEVTATDAEKQEQAAAEQAKKDAQNPKKSLKIGTRYIAVLPAGIPDADCRFILITFKDNGEYSYSMGDYSIEKPYPEATVGVTYEGKDYYSWSGLGGGGEYTLTDTEIILVQDNAVFVMNEKSELVIKSAKPGDQVFKAGQVFKILK